MPTEQLVNLQHSDVNNRNVYQLPAAYWPCLRQRVCDVIE